MTDADGLARWSGAAGEHWAAEADRYDRMDHHFGEGILLELDPRAGEHILDVGCGNGALSLAIAPRVAPAGHVLGLDLSHQMLEVARQRAAAQGVAGVELQHGDAQVHDLPPGGFDAIVSRFGVMFFADPHAAFANLARGLRPGGRLVFTCWQDMATNEWVMVPAAAALEHVPVPAGLGDFAAHRAFSLADPDTTTALLETSGLVDVTMTGMDAPMWIGSSVTDAVAFMQTAELGRALFSDVEPDRAAAGWDAVAWALADHVTPAGVELQGAAWLVTARAPARQPDQTPEALAT